MALIGVASCIHFVYAQKVWNFSRFLKIPIQPFLSLDRILLFLISFNSLAIGNNVEYWQITVDLSCLRF